MNFSLPSPHSIRRNLRLYFILQIVQLRAAVEYRADFWIGILGAMLQQAAGLVFISALFSQIPEVSGWTVWDIAILYGLAMIPKGLTEFFCDGPWMLRSKVNTGEFDRVLVRPISPALQSATAIASIPWVRPNPARSRGALAGNGSIGAGDCLVDVSVPADDDSRKQHHDRRN
jgi:hypothetical protein